MSAVLIADLIVCAAMLPIIWLVDWWIQERLMRRAQHRLGKCMVLWRIDREQ